MMDSGIYELGNDMTISNRRPSRWETALAMDAGLSHSTRRACTHAIAGENLARFAHTISGATS